LSSGERAGDTGTSIIFGRRKNCLASGKSLLLYRFTRMAIKLTVVIIEA
jgi:hypothetical protein